MIRSLKSRICFPFLATILSSLCFYFALALAAAPKTPPIAIISDGDHSDALAKVIRSLCDSESSCRHFEDAREVSSLLMRDSQAFDAIVAEVRRDVCSKRMDFD